MGSLLMDSPAVIFFNHASSLKSPKLAAALTADTHKSFSMGPRRPVVAKVRCEWLAATSAEPKFSVETAQLAVPSMSIIWREVTSA